MTAARIPNPTVIEKYTHARILFSFVNNFIFLDIRVALRLISSYGTLNEKSSRIVCTIDVFEKLSPVGDFLKKLMVNF